MMLYLVLLNHPPLLFDILTGESLDMMIIYQSTRLTYYHMWLWVVRSWQWLRWDDLGVPPPYNQSIMAIFKKQNFLFKKRNEKRNQFDDWLKAFLPKKKFFLSFPWAISKTLTMLIDLDICYICYLYQFMATLFPPPPTPPFRGKEKRKIQGPPHPACSRKKKKLKKNLMRRDLTNRKKNRG